MPPPIWSQLVHMFFTSFRIILLYLIVHFYLLLMLKQWYNAFVTSWMGTNGTLHFVMGKEGSGIYLVSDKWVG